MAHWLKVTKGIVRVVSIIVGIAFLINSLNGIASSVSLLDGESITQREIQPGDFEVNWDNQSVSVGMNINNTGAYDLEGIIVRIRFLINYDGVNYSILDVKSTDINESIPETGQTIKSGELKAISLKSSEETFDVTDFVVAAAAGGALNATNWDLKALLEEENSPFLAFMLLDFSVDYAFKQYEFDLQMKFETDAILEGL